MSAEFTARPYREGDEKGIVELLKLVWDGWPHLDLECSPVDHWRWKFQANPLPMRFVMVAESAGRIIGCHHAIPVRIKVGDDVLVCSTGADMAVHPDFREMGVTTKIGRELSEGVRREVGIKFDYHITGNPILIKSFERRKPRFPFEISNLVRITDIDEHLRKMPVDNELITKIGYSALKMLGDTKLALRGRKSRETALNIVEIRRFDEHIDEFWMGMKDKYSYIVERRSEYLNWRFSDPRAGRYVIKVVEDGGRIFGYSVLRINRYNREYPIGYIVDLLAPLDRVDAVEKLAADAVNFFEESQINIVNYQVVKGHLYGEILKGLGFLDSRIPLHMFYNPLGNPPMLDKLKREGPDRIYVSWGDHDVLPVSMPHY